MDFLIHWPPGPVVATVQCQGLWEMNQLFDHCIHAQEFRYLPHNCCVKIAWTLTVYFWRSIHFFTKNSDN